MKNYKRNKKITIATLSVIAISLAIGLFYVANPTNDSKLAEKPSVPQIEEDYIVVKPIVDDVADITETKDDIVVDEIEKTEDIADETEKTDDVADETVIEDDKISIPTTPVVEEKPQVSNEETKPVEPTKVEDKENLKDPAEEPKEEPKTETPTNDTTADGTINEAGTHTWLSGFGWVEGTGSGSESYVSETGESQEKIGH